MLIKSILLQSQNANVPHFLPPPLLASADIGLARVEQITEIYSDVIWQTGKF